MKNKIKDIIYDVVAKYYLRKPEQKGFIETRYPNFKSIYKVALNQFFYLIRSTYAPEITSIQFELTNCCNLKCKTCPVTNGMKRKKGFMDFNLFKKVMDENPHVGFVLLFNWGEPLLHREFWKFIDYLSDKKINVFFTTNAILLSDETMRRLVNSNVSRVTISLDGFKDSYEKIRKHNYNQIRDKILGLIKLRNSSNSKLKVDINMVVNEDTEKLVPQFYREWKGIVDRVQIQPFITFKNEDKHYRNRCKEFWRGNLIVLWDGTVTLCCVDYEGMFSLGNAKREKLSIIWNGKKMRELRRKHSRGEWHPICRTCTEYLTDYVNPRFE